MMKRMIGLMFVSAMLLSVSGCGGSDEASSVVGDSDQSAVQAYDDAIAEAEEEMNADPPTDE